MPQTSLWEPLFWVGGGKRGKKTLFQEDLLEEVKVPKESTVRRGGKGGGRSKRGVAS